MSRQLKEIRQILTAASDKTSIEFFKKMVPGKQKIYGVKTPVLNTIVRKYKSGSFELAEELWRSAALEEKIIAIKILEKTGRTDPNRLIKLFKKLSKQIDNWAVCDGLGMQFLRGIVITHHQEIFQLARKLSRSRDPWQRRLSLVMVEWYTRDAERHGEIRKLLDCLKDDEDYYVKKAVAWIKRNLIKGK